MRLLILLAILHESVTDELVSDTGGGITSIYGLAPHLGATSVALLPEATAQLTSPTPASPRRQAARSEGHAPAQCPQLALAACI